MIVTMLKQYMDKVNAELAQAFGDIPEDLPLELDVEVVAEDPTIPLPPVDLEWLAARAKVA